LLKYQPRKALLLPDNCAIFLENSNIYGATVSPAGEVEMVSAACIHPVACDDERGFWDSDVSAVITVAVKSAPVIIELPDFLEHYILRFSPSSFWLK
jgi:hypothetical protein